MGIIEQAKQTWSLRQMFGFFFFFMGILTLAVALDYGYENIFDSSPAILGLYSAFIYFAFALAVAVILYVLLNALINLKTLREKYRRG